MFGRSRLKKIYFELLRLSGNDTRLLKKIRERGLLVVLNLHQVSPHTNPFWPPLDPRLFEELLLFIKPRFNVCLFRDLGPETIADGSSRTPLVISFDDGYYNFVEYAMPLLAKHGLAANMNIIPACVESGLPPWNVQLYDFLNSVPRTLVNEIKLPDFKERLADDQPESKVRYGIQVSRYLKNRPRAARERLWPEIARVMERAPDFKRTRMMSAGDVREAAATHEIGAHSFSHESMEFEKLEFFVEDMEKCFDYFRHTLGLPLKIYAFPNGSHRPKQVELLRQAGIEHVLLVGEGFARPTQRVYERFTFYGDSPAEAKFRALGYNGRKSLTRI